MVRIGVLALQGAFAAHAEKFVALGAHVVEVRRAEHLTDLDGLVLPGGESTTMSNLLVSSGLARPLAEAIDSGLAVFGTCAGMILLSTNILDGRDDQISFSAIDATVRRNAYG
ncbi:MAG: pyridoxal 5'-phosphate synthase glutaminase subunit PdxT, partial [Actinobacteria bacterium]|nr:pyridoxal 5'-phosphate synthase glutaminase subunit PdxT [Actinomycetota bacterium]